MIDVVPVTLPLANRAVSQWHRHHAPIPAGFVWFCIGAVVNNQLVGVAISGRPTNRNNDDGATIEVLRVATDQTPHACSALLGACARAAKAIGAGRIITYTLDHESGSSLKGAGWTLEKAGINSRWNRGTSRRHAIARPHLDVQKIRWTKHFKPRPHWEFNPCPDESVEQLTLEGI